MIYNIINTVKKLSVLALALSLICTATLGLTACSKSNSNEQPSGYKVTQYNDLTGNQATFYTITTPDNKLVIIDGGWVGNEAQVRQVIAEHNNVVDAWIISHPHQDHAGAFNQIYANLNGITVRQIYDSPIDYNKVVQVGEKWDDIGIFDTYREVTKDANVIHLNRGDSFDLFGLNVKVLNAYDNYVLETSSDLSNDGALILKMSSENKSMLFCSDVKWMDDVLIDLYKDELPCDYIQVAHHGNWAFANEFYDIVNASVAFFDAPAWIMTDSAYPAYELSNYLKEKGATVYDFTTAPNSIYLD